MVIKMSWKEKVKEYTKNDTWPTEEMAMTYLGKIVCSMCGTHIPRRKIPVCKECGWPDMKAMMEYYKDRPQRMDMFYRMMEYFERKGWIVYTKVPIGTHGQYPSIHNVGNQVFNFEFADPLGTDIYLIWNIVDANNVSLREVVTSPHIAESVCERLRKENKKEGIIATVIWEKAPLNHPFASSMFDKSVPKKDVVDEL